MARMRIRLRLASARTSSGATALVLALGLLVAATPIGGVTQTPAAADLARSLQKRYAAIKDFRADFTQTASGGVLRMVKSEQRGEVKIKKPGRMRWTYGPPDRQVTVADGSRLYFYNPTDRTGYESPLPATGDNLSAPILFLTGRGDLERDFTASMPAAQPAGEWQLVLTPKKKQEEFASLTVAVDRATLAFRGFAWTDHQGAAHSMRFTNLRENVGLTDREFLFTFPKNAHVTRAGGGR
jgi:outer membrane lipoprotein carrier protein